MSTSLLALYITTNPNELTQEEILKLEHEFKHPSPNTISDEFLDYKLWCIGYPSRQELFATYLANKLPIYSNILEVGCGRSAKLARLLSKKGFCVTAMDPKVSYNSLSITTIKQSFNQNTNIGLFDYVIAQEPCEATEHIVRACKTQRIPFIMSLCGVPHKLISGKTPKSVEEWYKHLTSLDDKIKLRYVRFDPISQTAILKNF